MAGDASVYPPTLKQGICIHTALLKMCGTYMAGAWIGCLHGWPSFALCAHRPCAYATGGIDATPLGCSSVPPGRGAAAAGCWGQHGGGRRGGKPPGLSRSCAPIAPMHVALRLPWQPSCLWMCTFAHMHAPHTHAWAHERTHDLTGRLHKLCALLPASLPDKPHADARSFSSPFKPVRSAHADWMDAARLGC